MEMTDASRRVQSTLHQCLDKDPSRCEWQIISRLIERIRKTNVRTWISVCSCVAVSVPSLTTFPVPGFSASTYEAPDDVTEDTNALKSVAASLIKIGPSLTTVSNQYWMPDHLCKVCYDCSAAFSLFRRRHHCRLCGQIFCHECSASFIDGTPHGFPGAIRVCKFCVQLNDAASGKAKLRENGHIADGISDHEIAEKVILHRFDDSSCRLSGDYSCVKPSPFVFGPPVDPNEVRMPLMSLVNSDPSDPTRIDQQMDPRSRTTATADLFEGPDTLGAQEQFHSGIQSRRRRFSVELLSAVESRGLDAKVPFHEWPNKAIPEPDVLTAPEETQQELGTKKSDKFSRQRDIALDANMHRAYDRIHDGIMHSTSLVWNNLSEFESIELNALVETLKDMAFIVTGHMLYSMKFRSVRGFNYASLVKVKSIAKTASMLDKMNPSYDFKWLAGTVCHKHLSHKQMAREVTNPRILLFACGISYDRSNSAGRMSSLDTLLEQEKGYMAILVEKISALEPDVIFVENAVSRHAQELLYERRISIVLNVKKEILHRIARHTGAEVLTSVDHVDRVEPEKAIGSCRSFTVKSVPKVLDEGRATKTLHTLAGVVTKTAAASNRLQTDTYLYVDGCDPLNGCTVLITGPSKQASRLLKRLTRDALSMTYHLLLEAHVLSDLELSNNTQMPWKGGAELVNAECATWCTTSTLRVHDPGSLNPRYRQCVEAKHLRIPACSDDDMSFGNFLDQELAALSLKCQNVKCNRLMADHVHVFSCRTGSITISFENLPEKSKPPFSLTKMSHGSSSEVVDESFGSFDELSRTMNSISLPLLMTPRSTFHTSKSGDEAEIKVQNGCPTLTFSRWCRECNSVVTPFVPLAKYVYKYSFARLLEVLFSEAEQSFLPLSSSPTCAHTSKESHVLFFNINKSVARFDFSKQVSLRLDRANFKHDNRTPHAKPPFAQCGHVVAKKEVVSRLETLKKLLDLLINTFNGKVQGINRAVKAFEDNDLGRHTRIILEAVCISKIVRSGDAVFSHRLALVGGSLVDALSACDAFQRALYLMACKWITCMLCLRDSIEKNLTMEVASLSSHSKSFTPGEFALLSPTLLSPTRLPRMAKALTLPPRTIDTEFDGGTGADLLIRGRSTGALDSTSASGSITDTLLLSSSLTFATFETSMRSTVLLPDASTNEEEEEEDGWKKALWDLHRVLGQTEPGSEFSIDFPEALTAGHPSLPNRSKSLVVLVDEVKPITNVAYALSTTSYQEELDGWNIRMHGETVGSVAAHKQQEMDAASATSMNVSRAALEAPLNAPFKFEAEEMPLHMSLFSGKMSSTQLNTRWEFSTIVHYPLQFQVLRELFYGNHPGYVFSIAHVASWDAKGGKSGASFYRTLDGRFVVKHISSIEMQSFLNCLPEYFKYVASIYFDGRASLLSKTVGLYQTTISRKDTGEKAVYYICVMENIFYQKQLTQVFDLKGSARNRFAKPQPTPEDFQNGSRVLLDGNFLEVTRGRPVAVLAEDHRYISEAVQNDTAFLNSIRIVDYSMVVGLGHRLDDTGEEKNLSDMTVGIIDYFRQFDLIKRVESVGKSVSMIAGQSSPTIIEPILYGNRFQAAIRRYFMPVSPISSGTNDDIKD